MTASDTVKVWDPFVRVFHWTLVVAFFTCYISEGEPAWLHTTSGYVVFGLVLARVVWGFAGPESARFASFAAGPVAAFRYLSEEWKGRAKRYLTHNPAGGAMVIAVLVMLVSTTLAGMTLYAADAGAGPFAGFVPRSENLKEQVEEVHEFFANATLLLVIAHVAGVALSSLRHRENLVGAMFTGQKRQLEKS